MYMNMNMCIYMYIYTYIYICTPYSTLDRPKPYFSLPNHLPTNLVG